MSEIIIYITSNDAETIRKWLNSDEDIAWIVKVKQEGCTYWWKAVDKLEEIRSGEYCLWHKASSPLNIPSRSSTIKDEIITDPYNGWEQILDNENEETPWFGSAFPGPYSFKFKELGSESENSIGRSGFNFIGNYFSVIGKPAPKVTMKWWERLRRFVKKNSTGIPWPGEIGSGKTGAYAFPDAYEQMISGRARDINP